MAFMKLSWEEALNYVQKRRKMAQPNPGFMKLLESLNRQDQFISFAKELGGHVE